MSKPEIGVVYYGVSFPSSRPGDLRFLTHTQDHISLDKEKAIAEAVSKEVRSGPGEFDWSRVVDPELEKRVMVWEMRRIQ